MRDYDQIVVGGGISGLTLAALLGLNGKRVLLLEKGQKLGGSMSRFRRRGIPFDTGFHFTGCFADDGVLSQMLRVFGIADAIRIETIQRSSGNRFVFENSGNAYEQPVEYGDLVETVVGYFPSERDGIEQYFSMIENVCKNTVSMELRTITESTHPIVEESVSLKDVLDDLISCPELKTFLAAYAMCYGTPPDEVSFANHSRIAYGLYHSIARVAGGGQAFVDALCAAFSAMDVDVRLGTTISECADIQGARAKRFVLTTDDVVRADDCVFTIHPRNVLEVLPHNHLHKAFINRVNAFEPSIGLFSVYGVVRNGGDVQPFSSAIISHFPNSDIQTLLRPDGADDRAMVIMKHQEMVEGEPHNVLTAHEVAIPTDTQEWSTSSTGHRPDGYSVYKRERTERIRSRVLDEFPEYAGQLDVLASASMLTFRDYLHSPWGCAYGIKQKIGQFNLFGRLPIRNLYVAGQSAVLPGLVGAMLSSFIIARTLIGRDAYQHFIDRRLSASRQILEAST